MYLTPNSDLEVIWMKNLIFTEHIKKSLSSKVFSYNERQFYKSMARPVMKFALFL